LLRATAPFQDANPAPQTFTYDPVWLTPFTFAFNQALLLKMNKVAPGEYRDLDNNIIIADGSVEFLGCTPYTGFTAWCDAKGLDWFIFGWDWRRPLEDAAAFFVSKFLPHFQARVIAECGGADPLADFSLIGHSFGGMLVNWILRANDPIVATMSKAITVATPFYGYAGQVHRWFEGDSLVNGPFDILKLDIIKVISSLPGCYALQYMDEATYTTYQAALAADPNYPLAAYPSVDAVTKNVADPYHPGVNGTYIRYPAKATTGFDNVELANGAAVVMHLNSDPLPPALAAKFFNIRGVHTTSSTASANTWGWLAPTKYDPTPITDAANLPGDDTQPAWTARLVTLPAAQVITIAGNHISHQFIMNHPKALHAIGNVLGA
jgi:hypothetical protein